MFGSNKGGGFWGDGVVIIGFMIFFDDLGLWSIWGVLVCEIVVYGLYYVMWMNS